MPKHILILATGLLLLSGLVTAQEEETPPSPCDTPEAGQFDFWLGEWQVSWGDTSHGSNTVTKILDGCVIQENFDGRPGTRLRGMSHSTYNHKRNIWQQTWVDNNGSYLDFTGKFEDGKMVLSRETTFEGQPAIQRMVWYNINKDELDWNWERSLDGGKTWTVLWQVHYARK